MVFVCCWSSKGGSGTTVVAAALAVVLSKSSGGGAGSGAGALLVDLCGDVPAVLGLPDEPAVAGVAEWLSGGELVPADGMARVEVSVRDGLGLLPRGLGTLAGARAGALSALLASDPRAVVVDAGALPASGADQARTELIGAMSAAADHSLLVLRPCFLALRRATASAIRPTGIVLLTEEGRALTAADVEEVLGVPVQASVNVTPQIARAVDAGLLASRLPRTLERELRHAA
jgi:hypothetical protein